MAQMYGKKTSDRQPKAIEVTDKGELKIASAIDPIQTLGTGMKTMAGAAQDITIPAGALMCLLTARGGAIYYEINGDASDASGGYLPEEGSLPVYLSGVTQLSVYGVMGSFAHYTFHGGAT